MARASVAEQTGSTGELEAAAKFTRITGATPWSCAG